MKRLINIFSLVMIFAFALTSCNDDDVKLDIIDVKPSELVEGIAFSVTPDAKNPNIIYLESKMGSSYTPLWEHPQGRSQKNKVTLQIPFDGEYEVTFGVMTRGGVVYGEPYKFQIESFCADFVNDDLWTFLSGGVGKSKTWVYNNGNYGLEATGEVGYGDPSTTVEWNNFAFNWDPGKGHSGDDNIWNSTMTFTLDGGAFVNTINTYTDGEAPAEKVESGTFMLDVENHTLSFTDCTLMHTVGWDFKTTTTGWSKNLKILTLTENFLQVAVLRDPNTSGEGEWWLIWSYVSKDWADSYVPGDQPDPVPNIDGDANDIITTTRTKSWVLSLNSPYDWATLEGDMMNGFSSPNDYNNGWSAYNADMIAATKLVFTAGSGNSGSYVFSTYDNEDVEGTYTIDANNDITFDKPLNAMISHTNWGWDSYTYLSTTDENKLRIIKTKTDVMGNVTEMWLGKRDPEKSEYTAFHFEVGAGGTPSVDPVKVLKDRLTSGSSLTYKASLVYPFCWAYKVGDPSSFSIGPNDAFPDWTGWSESAYQYAEKIRFTFNNDGSVTFVDNNGATQAGTFAIVDGDSGYGADIVKFNGVDVLDSEPITYTGPGGWVNFCFNYNPDALLANAPTDAGWLELYSWEYDADGNVSGIWLGIIQAGGVVDGKDLTAERRVFHFVVE